MREPLKDAKADGRTERQLSPSSFNAVTRGAEGLVRPFDTQVDQRDGGVLAKDVDRSIPRHRGSVNLVAPRSGPKTVVVRFGATGDRVCVRDRRLGKGSRHDDESRKLASWMPRSLARMAESEKREQRRQLDALDGIVPPVT